MERSERTKVGLYMMIASIPFFIGGIYVQFTMDSFYYFIPYGIAVLLLAEGANRFIKNKWGKAAEEGLAEQPVPTEQPKTLEVMS